MTAAKIAGVALVASPFAAFTGYMIHDGGWTAALSVWGIVLVVAVIIGIGFVLIERGKEPT